MPKSEKFQQLPAPWDRIFSLGTRLFVWGLLITILYILRPFFLLIFLTFVFAYVQSHGVDGLAHRFPNRIYRVVLVAVVFLGLITGTFYFVVPHVQEQTSTVIRDHPTYMADADRAIYKFSENMPWLRNLVVDSVKKGPHSATETHEPTSGRAGAPLGGHADTRSPRPLQSPGLDAPRNGDERPGTQSGEPLPALVSSWVSNLEVKGVLLHLASSIFGVSSAFLLSLLFSFLIVLDLPILRKSVAGLANTRLDFIYEEVADNIYEFGRVLGRALEAQLIIAICNTTLTAIGITIMGLPNVVFLATVVFFCSFIPVAGVFISSAPICLLALQKGGLQSMVIAIGLITVIHFIEAYFLNPKIFGHHLRMNAVMVLIVLTVGGKIFGIWGLVLGLPVVNYVFGTAIRRRPEDEVGADAVRSVPTG